MSGTGLGLAPAGLVTVAAAVCAVAVIAFLGWAYAMYRLRALAIRLGKVDSAVERMTGGNLAARAVLPGNDPAARLADSVNDLAAHVQAEREAELQRAASQRRLLTNVAHDLRTPITSIAGYVGALRQGIGKAEDRERYLAIIAQKTEELVALVDDLFYKARLDSGDLALATERVDLAELVRQVVLGFAPQLEAAGVRVSISIPDERCEVTANETALRRVFSNIISNSLRHGADKTAFGVDLSREGGSYLVTVWDDGQGLSPEALSRVFERGADPDAAGRAGGAGLGLAIARELVEKSGGSISATSVPRQRTAFSVSLPASSA